MRRGEFLNDKAVIACRGIYCEFRSFKYPRPPPSFEIHSFSKRIQTRPPKSLPQKTAIVQDSIFTTEQRAYKIFLFMKRMDRYAMHLLGTNS